MSVEHRALVGLGNPGERYKQTRHNVGFMVVERLASRWNCGAFKARGNVESQVHRRSSTLQVHLLKPQTFMNLSGQALHQLRRDTGISPEHILAIVDEFALPLGQIRLRANGSAGGHNGMKSLIAELGGQNFPRLRMGIGPVPPGWQTENFVLGRFNASEQEALESMIVRACECVETWLDEGIAAAMNRFN